MPNPTYTKGNEVATIDVALVTITDNDGNTYGLKTSNKVDVTPVTETRDAITLIVKRELIAQKPQEVIITGNTLTLTDNVFNPQVVQILQGGVIEFSKKYSAASASITTGTKYIQVGDEYLVFTVAEAVTAAVEYNDVSGVLELVTSNKRMRKSYTVVTSAPQSATEITVTNASDESRIKKYTPPAVGELSQIEPFTVNCYSAIYDAAGLINGYEKITYPNCKGTPVAFGSEDDVFRAPEYTINSAPNTGESPYTIEYVPRLPVEAE